MSTTTHRHGTHAGWAAHQRNNERPCDPCFRAKAEYDKRRLQAPANTWKNRLRAGAQQKARTRLVNAHKDEYRALYNEELARAFADYYDKEETDGKD